MRKCKPRHNFGAMTRDDWKRFDEVLKPNLLKGLTEEEDLVVGNTSEDLFCQYGRLAGSLQKTIEEVVPLKKKQKYNGRGVSDRTKKLFEERARDYSTGRTIKKSDRNAWNRVIAKSCKQDYVEWVTKWVESIKQADTAGDTKAIRQGVKVLSGTTRCLNPTQPNIDEQGGFIQGAEQLSELWQRFLEGEFAATELEEGRQAYEALPKKTSEEEGDLTREEFRRAIKKLKIGKATGPDNIPSQIWKHSLLARNELFHFLHAIWRLEKVPKNLALGAFVMIYKKGDHNNCKNYRPIGLLNHAYKALSLCLLERLVKETGWFLSDWQAGFRSGRGCRDNVLLLRVIYDHFIKERKECVVTFIDFAGAFTSTSHKYIDKALKSAGASRKTRALFRAIYDAAIGTARVKGIDGKFTFSHIFDIARGVIQGDIISPIFFIIALDQLVQQLDPATDTNGVGIGKINRIRVLGYADDAAMLATSPQELTDRLTRFADGALQEADMQVKLPKTFTQFVQVQPEVPTATQEDIDAVQSTYPVACDFEGAGCKARFKTKRAMLIHRNNCSYNYGTTDKAWEVDKILNVFGKADHKLFLVQWTDKPGEDSWQPEHLLLRDGCKESIDDFWLRSGANPALDFYADKTGTPRCWMCGWESTAKNKVLGLKTHIRRAKHK